MDCPAEACRKCRSNRKMSGVSDGVFPLRLFQRRAGKNSPLAFPLCGPAVPVHAGCDLYFRWALNPRPLQPVLSRADHMTFLLRNFALEVDHGPFLLVTGEIQSKTEVSAGVPFGPGQNIARVGHFVGIQGLAQRYAAPGTL